jgi:hypothetical protein
MARPRVDKYADVDQFLMARVMDEARVGFRSPTELIRRVVERCWAGDPDYFGILAEFFPPVEEAQLYASLVDGQKPVAGGLLTPVFGRGPDGLRGAWLYAPSLETIRGILGQSEEAVVKRLLRRCTPESLRYRGKVLGFTVRALIEKPDGTPMLPFDRRRGRSRNGEFK